MQNSMMPLNHWTFYNLYCSVLLHVHYGSNKINYYIYNDDLPVKSTLNVILVNFQRCNIYFQYGCSTWNQWEADPLLADIDPFTCTLTKSKSHHVESLWTPLTLTAGIFIKLFSVNHMSNALLLNLFFGTVEQFLFRTIYSMIICSMCVYTCV